ncbi:MAG: hypothetical protein HY580_03845 [Nitrospinae bacterium]|nr:hypothetical protein [Nitrospinota bacterium]
MNKKRLVLFLIGVCLSVAQFVMVRDFVALLYGEEVVIALVNAAFFLGMSIGYLLSLRISRETWESLFAASMFLQLTFPFSYRYLSAWTAFLGARGFWFLVLLFVFALIFSSAFSTFLPRLVSGTKTANVPLDPMPPPAGAAAENPLHPPLQKPVLSLPKEGPGGFQRSGLKSLYTCELLGFAVGLGAVAWSWNRPLPYLLVPYWFLLAAVLHMTLARKKLTLAFLTAIILPGGFSQGLDLHSASLLYQYKHRIDRPEALYSINSPYQKVEVVQNENGERYLYLDGLQNLNSGDLEELNYYIAELPASLAPPGKTLIVGNGSLSSVPKLYPLSREIVSVELDAGVLQAGKRFFTPPGRLSGLDRWTLRVDDGKHFLRNSKDRYGLIVMDVPSPLTLQEAGLHTQEFYELVKQRLTPEGVLSVQLSGKLQRNNRTPARIASALTRVFPETMAVYSPDAGRGFAYASRKLPFTEQDVRGRTLQREPDLKIIPPGQIGVYLDKAEPLALDNMDLVLRRGWERFAGRYLNDD